MKDNYMIIFPPHGYFAQYVTVSVKANIVRILITE